ncbi:MAG: hypothetical protein QOE70_3389 [Chthoniobacter sp.]|jgi:hypothetical protein|nr:hypothetical protein [Chthoniobacter sp.]
MGLVFRSSLSKSTPMIMGVRAIWPKPLMKFHRLIACSLLGWIPTMGFSQAVLRNDLYTLEVAADGTVAVRVAGMPAQHFVPEFTVLWSETDPLCTRNPSHPNYPVAPRNALRWRHREEPLEALNAWVAAPEFKSATGLSGAVWADGKQRVWEFRDAADKVKVRVTGERAFDTTRPFTVGHRVVMQPVRHATEANRVRWEYPPQPEFTLVAELALPAGVSDPEVTYTLTPRREGFFSVAFTGAPEAALPETLPVPQECEARGHKQFGFVMSEADLHLPRVHVATAAGNVALVAEPRECRFRLATLADSRFGLMLAREAERLKPVLLAPLLGGPESRMRAGEAWQFVFRWVVRAGDWKETYAHIARDLHGFRDQRDNSGPGSLNATLERVMDFLADRRGGNHALWDTQQKYYDYFTDKTGVFKPFSPLYGLSAAIVTDDEEFFRQRARPAAEYALSRRTSVFAPYDNADNKQANSAGREVGAPYIGYTQLLSLHALFQSRTPALRALAEAKGPAKGDLSDALARWRLTGEAAALEEARQAGARTGREGAVFGEETFFDLLDLADETREAQPVSAALEAAYHNAAKMNLYPVPPEATVTVDRGGFAPVHYHSFGRHRNQWGFPPPQPVRAPEQTVPAWRIARLGLPGIAYPIEYWMNTHGAMLRTAGLAHDDFLRDVARWGMVGRFGNFPGDNRSQDSLLPELPDAVESRPWDWNFATVNPGHAWDFAGAVLDFLVSDAFEHSRGAIDFPALSAAGSNFRVRIYGGQPGQFYGDEGVHLWLPRGLVASDNRQLDWLAGHGNGQVYLALWNQSFREETAAIALDAELVQCDPEKEARVWRDHALAAPLRVTGNRLILTLPPKGIIALAIPAKVKPRLQARLYDPTTTALGPRSFAQVTAPFGPVHAMLLRAGTGLTSAFIYTEALPEQVIAARLRWRQGEGAWQELTDEIYPYEFSPELRDDAGDFAGVLEIEDAQQRLLRSSVITLALAEAPASSASAAPGTSGDRASGRVSGQEASRPQPQPAGGNGSIVPTAGKTVSRDANAGASPSDDFIAYFQRAANTNDFGRRADGRYYPYSTPEGRRIGSRQAVWDKALFANGCSREEAGHRLRADLSRALAELKIVLASRQPAVVFAELDQRQQETLLDFAQTEGVTALRPELMSTVLARDWPRLAGEHLYVRYAGHAPDHPRNKAFADRWGISDPR